MTKEWGFILVSLFWYICNLSTIENFFINRKKNIVLEHKVIQEGLWLHKGVNVGDSESNHNSGRSPWLWPRVLAEADTGRMPVPFKLGNLGKWWSAPWANTVSKLSPASPGVSLPQLISESLVLILDPFFSLFFKKKNLWINSFSLFLDSPVVFLNERCCSGHSKWASPLQHHVHWRLWQREGNGWDHAGWISLEREIWASWDTTLPWRRMRTISADGCGGVLRMCWGVKNARCWTAHVLCYFLFFMWGNMGNNIYAYSHEKTLEGSIKI